MQKSEEEEEEEVPSSAAFLAAGGGDALLDASDDCCSICLEPFCSSDPASVTSCEHEYHVQCILEWFQRSRECPMCWQPLSLKDPCSQELLDGVEQEKKPWTGYSSSEDSLETAVPAYSDNDLEEPTWDHVLNPLQQESMASMGMRQSNFQGNGGQSHGLRRFGWSMRERPVSEELSSHSNRSHGLRRFGQEQGVSEEGEPSHQFSSRGDRSYGLRRFGRRQHERRLPENGEALAPSSQSIDAGGPLHGLERQDDNSERVQSQQWSSSVIQPLKSRFLVASTKCKQALTSTTRNLREKWQHQRNKVEQNGARAQEELRRAMKRISPVDVATTSSALTGGPNAHVVKPGASA